MRTHTGNLAGIRRGVSDLQWACGTTCQQVRSDHQEHGERGQRQTAREEPYVDVDAGKSGKMGAVSKTSRGARRKSHAHKQGAPETSFLHSLTQARLLTAHEEHDLAVAARANNQEAKNRLIESNMRLVVSIAKHYRTSLVPFEDLVQEGSIGLITAVERYDPDKGCRFSTYATHWIRQAISRAIDNKSRAIRVPAHVSEMLRRIERARAALKRDAGEEPTTEQIASTLGLPVERVAAYLRAGQDPVSLDMLVGDEDNTTLGALIYDRSAIDPEDTVIRQEIERELLAVLDTLNPRERTIMRRRFGFEEKASSVLQDIGDSLHISRERVRQIEAQALKRLRAIAIRRHLHEFLAG